MNNYLEKITEEGLFAKKYRLFNSALITIILAIEYSLIEALISLGIDVYEENRRNKNYYHTLPELTGKAFGEALITQKMQVRLTVINMLRRSAAHSKSGETIEADVSTALESLRQLLRELQNFGGAQSPLVQGLHSRIRMIENNVAEQKNVSFMGLSSHTNEIGGSYAIDWMLSFALSICDRDTLCVLGIITKYRPPNAQRLKELLGPFQLGEQRVNEILKVLVISGAIWIGHPHDAKVTDPDLAPMSIGKDLLEELRKYFGANWRILFRCYKGIEEDFNKPRDI